MWSSNGTQLTRTNNTSSTTVNNSLVYTDSYNVSQLNTINDVRIRVIKCEVVINADTSVMACDNITLDETSK